MATIPIEILMWGWLTPLTRAFLSIICPPSGLDLKYHRGEGQLWIWSIEDFLKGPSHNLPWALSGKFYPTRASITSNLKLLYRKLISTTRLVGWKVKRSFSTTLRPLTQSLVWQPWPLSDPRIKPNREGLNIETSSPPRSLWTSPKSPQLSSMRRLESLIQRRVWGSRTSFTSSLFSNSSNSRSPCKETPHCCSLTTWVHCHRRSSSELGRSTCWTNLLGSSTMPTTFCNWQGPWPKCRARIQRSGSNNFMRRPKKTKMADFKLSAIILLNQGTTYWLVNLKLWTTPLAKRTSILTQVRSKKALRKSTKSRFKPRKSGVSSTSSLSCY